MIGRHIHVHLHQTRDAGEFVEAKHPRSHGKFAKAAGPKGSAKSAPSKSAPATTSASTSKATAKPSPGPQAKQQAKQPDVSALHAAHEKVARSIVNMVKNDPFLGNYAQYPDEYGDRPLVERKNPDGSVEFGIRNMGQWVNPPEARNDEDYDWQIPTEKTKKAIENLADRIEKQHNVKLEVAGSEKNYIDFTIKPK